MVIERGRSDKADTRKVTRTCVCFDIIACTDAFCGLSANLASRVQISAFRDSARA